MAQAGIGTAGTGTAGGSRVLAILLLASGLKLLGVPSEIVLAAAVAALLLGSLAWAFIRSRFRRRQAARRTTHADPPVVDA